jgi:hypothetical protein
LCDDVGSVDGVDAVEKLCLMWGSESEKVRLMDLVVSLEFSWIVRLSETSPAQAHLFPRMDPQEIAANLADRG